MVQRPRPDLRGGCAAMRIPTVTGVKRRWRPLRGHRVGREYASDARIHRLQGHKTALSLMRASTLTPRILVLPTKRNDTPVVVAVALLVRNGASTDAPGKRTRRTLSAAPVLPVRSAGLCALPSVDAEEANLLAAKRANQRLRHPSDHALDGLSNGPVRREILAPAPRLPKAHEGHRGTPVQRRH